MLTGIVITLAAATILIWCWLRFAAAKAELELDDWPEDPHPKDWATRDAYSSPDQPDTHRENI